MCKNCQKWLSHFINVFICVAKTLSEERLGHKLLFQNSQKANKTVPTDQQRDTFRLQASLTPHAPPGGFSQTHIFVNLIHRPIEIRLSAKIPTLGEAVRALFFKMASKIQYIA